MKALQRAIEIEEMIHEKVSKDIYVGVGINGYNERTKYIYMYHINDKNYFGLEKMKDSQILSKAKELCESNFTKISTVCLDLIGKEVYIDKEIPIVIKGISKDESGNNIVTSDTGKTFSADSLYLKG